RIECAEAVTYVSVRFAFEQDLAEEFGRVSLAVLDGRWEAKVIGSTREDGAAPVLTDQQELSQHLFTGMFGGELVPPGKAAYTHQLLPIVEAAGPTNPGDLVAQALTVADKAALQMERVGGIVDLV